MIWVSNSEDVVRHGIGRDELSTSKVWLDGVDWDVELHEVSILLLVVDGHLLGELAHFLGISGGLNGHSFGSVHGCLG